MNDFERGTTLQPPDLSRQPENLAGSPARVPDDVQAVRSPEAARETAAGAHAVELEAAARTAQTAIRAAIEAAGPVGHSARQVLAAELALKLARLGYADDVRFQVRSGTPLASIHAALAAAVASTAQPHASSRIAEVCKRACLTCGQVFEVNPRHARSHRFCSARCRWRQRRGEARDGHGSQATGPHRRAENAH